MAFSFELDKVDTPQELHTRSWCLCWYLHVVLSLESRHWTDGKRSSINPTAIHPPTFHSTRLGSDRGPLASVPQSSWSFIPVRPELSSTDDIASNMSCTYIANRNKRHLWVVESWLAMRLLSLVRRWVLVALKNKKRERERLRRCTPILSIFLATMFLRQDMS